MPRKTPHNILTILAGSIPTCIVTGLITYAIIRYDDFTNLALGY